MNYLDKVKTEFNNKVSFFEKRPGIYQLICPLYHEDGDMVDIFLTEVDSGKIRILDYGMTLMRLSYSYELNSENKTRIFNKILKEHRLSCLNGTIYFDTDVENIFSSIMHFSQVIAKVGSMQYFKKEVIKSLFYELLDEFVYKKFKEEYEINKKFHPLPDREELEVDYAFKLPKRDIDIFLFGVKNETKARLVTISNLEFLRNNVGFRSFVVYEDIDKVNPKDRNMLLRASDKQFPNFDDFKQQGEIFVKREATG